MNLFKTKYRNIEELYQENQKLVYKFISDYTDDSHLIVELAQQVWIKVWQKFDKIENLDKTEAKKYLRALTHNLVMDYFEEKKRREDQMAEITYIMASEEIETIEDLTDLFQEKTMEAYLAEAMKVLTPTEEYMIHLKFDKQIRSPEIGVLLDMSDGVVRVKLQRILKKLKKEIERLKEEQEYE